MNKKSGWFNNTFKILTLELLISTVGILFGFTWEVYNETKKWDSLIYPGIAAENINLSGKTKEESISLVKSQYIDELLKKQIHINANNINYNIDYSKLVNSYDVDSQIENAYKVGKDLDLFSKHKLIRTGVNKNYNIDIVYNDNRINEFIENIDKEVSRQPVDASIDKINSDKFLIKPETKGYKLSKDKLKDNIQKVIKSPLNENINIEAQMEIIEPKITEEKLSSINAVVASYSTNFSSSSKERSHNIELASQYINGRVLLPGDIFSFNDSVGERTIERGFKEAPVIVDRKIESGLGGGICQVSSTLYNVVLKAGINPLDRTHHTLPSSYVGLGLDATVDWNNIDFRFKNTYNYPILIESFTKNKNIYINIYSNEELSKKKYIVENDVYETIKSNTKVVFDSNLPIGYDVKTQEQYNGYKVRVTRKSYENGVMVNSEIISNDFYVPVTGIVKKGTKS